MSGVKSSSPMLSKFTNKCTNKLMQLLSLSQRGASRGFLCTSAETCICMVGSLCNHAKNHLCMQSKWGDSEAGMAKFVIQVRQVEALQSAKASLQPLQPLQPGQPLQPRQPLQPGRPLPPPLAFPFLVPPCLLWSSCSPCSPLPVPSVHCFISPLPRYVFTFAGLLPCLFCGSPSWSLPCCHFAIFTKWTLIFAAAVASCHAGQATVH
jgi:hypothetical protein